MNLTRTLLYLSILFNGYFLVSCNNNSRILNLDIESEDTITCVKHVTRKYFPCGTLITFVNQDKDINQLIQGVTDESCYNIIVQSANVHNFLVWTNVYIITFENITEFTTTISKLRRNMLWNPRGKFIFILQHLDLNEISSIFARCVQYKIYNVLLLTKSSKEIVLHTYHSFNDGNCGKEADIVNLGPCYKINDTTVLYPNKIPTTFRNCTFRVIASEDIPNFIFSSSNFTVHGKPILGLEQYMLQIIQEREGVTINYTLTTDRYGVVLPNGSATGQLRYLQKDKSDIAAGGFILMKNRLQMFRFIGGHNFASFRVFTPKVGDAVWQDVYREFGITTWLLIFLSFGLVTIICFKISNSALRNTQNRVDLFLSLLGGLCGNASTKMLKDKKLRKIMICWVWFSFFITSFYNTALYSLITRRVKIKHHIKPENLDELPFQPCITETTRTFFQFAYNKNLPEGKHYPECYSTDTALKFIASRNDLYSIEMDYTYILNEFNYVDEDGIPRLDSTEFSDSSVIGFYVSRGFIFEGKMVQYTSRMTENGLLSRQLKMILQQNEATALRRLKRFKKIRLSDFRIHFCVLLLGCAISVICLAYEIKNKSVVIGGMK